MSMYTPGPWRIDDNRNVIVVAGAGYSICDCFPGNPIDVSLSAAIANARLIAAAPDLLAACASICGVFDGHEDVPLYVRKARAALRKAEA